MSASTSDAPPLPEPAATTADRTLRLLSAETRTPFFLWVHIRLPHAPYDATASEFRRMHDVDGPTFFSLNVPPRAFFRALTELTERFRARGEPVTTMNVVNGSRHDTTPSVVGQVRALYDANVRLGDEAFGRIVTYLKRRGLMSRTVVVVAADHGEALGEHDVVGHNGLSFPMLHTPLIVHVPGRRGRRSTTPVMNVDILPTVAALVGVPLRAPVRGGDAFAPRGPDAVQYAEYVNRYTIVRWPDKVDATTFTIKVVEKDAAGRPMAPNAAGFRMVDQTTSRVGALWNVERDPAETTNRAAEHPEIGPVLTGLRDALLAPRLVTEPRPPAEDVFERLKALGYVERDPMSGR